MCKIDLLINFSTHVPEYKICGTWMNKEEMGFVSGVIKKEGGREGVRWDCIAGKGRQEVEMSYTVGDDDVMSLPIFER